MKAIAYTQSLPIENPDSLKDIELDTPEASGRDLLIKVDAIAVNPVDYKIRQRISPENEKPKVLGWDATGEVVAIGDQVSLFKIGDKVYYAGDLTRQGSNAEYQLVDERIVGRKPASLSNPQAAAMPLTTLTAYELLFDRLQIAKQNIAESHKTDEVILVVGAAGGVGSILLQLAKKLTGATVIATASRKETREWATQLGADYVVDHCKPLAEQIRALGIDEVTHVASLTHTDSYFESYVEILQPGGKIGLIDDPESLDVSKLKLKSISLHWEFMYTRSMFQTRDIQAQHELLNEVADLIDAGAIQTTLGKHLGQINAENLRTAHQILESGKSIGKIVMEGF